MDSIKPNQMTTQGIWPHTAANTVAAGGPIGVNEGFEHASHRENLRNSGTLATSYGNPCRAVGKYRREWPTTRRIPGSRARPTALAPSPTINAPTQTAHTNHARRNS